jgi:hypothetical protein
MSMDPTTPTPTGTRAPLTTPMAGTTRSTPAPTYTAGGATGAGSLRVSVLDVG